MEYRNEHGRFRSRMDLMAVPGFGPKTFEQAAGFLRIRDGENPLDMTAVHPESYPVVTKIAESLGTTVGELIAKPELIERVKLEGFATASVGMYTLGDIREELRKPGRDPRDKFVAAKWRDDVQEISDLKPGMQLEGVVTNVTRFGAFVDIGVHQSVCEGRERSRKSRADRKGASAERRPEGEAHRAIHEGTGGTGEA